MNEIITTRRDQIASLCQVHRVRRLAVFGSVLRDDFDPERSDIDLLVELDEGRGNYFELLEDLTRLFARKVDLVSWNSIDNPYFKRAVERSQQTLYAA